jgi:putative FmdB family regulatory protein
MPVYTYRCGNCGIQFDRHLKYTDKPLTRCPECSKKSLKKVISPVRVVFKGSGFYATDHKSPSGQKDSSSSKPEKPKETEVKAESKTETKTESTPAKSTSESKE